jgi:hypothetical protein
VLLNRTTLQVEPEGIQICIAPLEASDFRPAQCRGRRDQHHEPDGKQIDASQDLPDLRESQNVRDRLTLCSLAHVPDRVDAFLREE